MREQRIQFLTSKRDILGLTPQEEQELIDLTSAVGASNRYATPVRVSNINTYGVSMPEYSDFLPVVSTLAEPLPRGVSSTEPLSVPHQTPLTVSYDTVGVAFSDFNSDIPLNSIPQPVSTATVGDTRGLDRGSRELNIASRELDREQRRLFLEEDREKRRLHAIAMEEAREANNDYAKFSPSNNYSTAAHVLGRSISGAESVGAGVVGGAKIGLGLTREILSGVGSGMRASEEERERRRQRPIFEGVFQDGGSIPLPKELTGQYLTGGEPTDSNPEIANIEGGEYLMQRDGQIQEAIGPPHSEGGIPLTREEVPMSADVLSDDTEIGKDGQKYLQEIYPSTKFHFKDTYSKAFKRIEKTLGVDSLIADQEDITKQIVYQEENVEGDTADMNTEYLMEKLHENQIKLDQMQALREAAFEVIYTMQEEEKGESPEMQEAVADIESQLGDLEGMLPQQPVPHNDFMGEEVLEFIPPPQDNTVPVMRSGGVVAPKVGTRTYIDSKGSVRAYTVDKRDSIPKILQDGGSIDGDAESTNSTSSVLDSLFNSYAVSSSYGAGRGSRNHRGLDLVNITSNHEIPSLFEGTVTKVGNEDGGYGNYIEVRRDNGEVVRYAHLNSISVSKGDKVMPGDTIGVEGNTGRVFSTTGGDGRHLHLEVVVNGELVDPAKYIGNNYNHGLLKEGSTAWKRASDFIINQGSGIDRLEYYETLKNVGDGFNVGAYNTELVSELRENKPFQEASMSALSKPQVYNITQDSGDGDTVDNANKDAINEALTSLYSQFPQVFSSIEEQDIFTIGDNGEVTLNDGVDFSRANPTIKALQEGLNTEMDRISRVILDSDEFTLEEKEAAQRYRDQELFNSESGGTRALPSIRATSQESLDKLAEYGITRTSQITKESLDAIKGLTEADKGAILARIERLPENSDFMLDALTETAEIGENYEVAEVDNVDIDTLLDEPRDGSGLNLDLSTEDAPKQRILPTYQMPPSGLQAPERHSVRLGRVSPISVGTDAQLAEINRQVSFSEDVISTLPPAQRVAAEAELRSQASLARESVLGQAELQNAQLRAQAQEQNIQTSNQEQLSNIQLAQDYEQKVFQTQATDEANWRNFYNSIADADRVARLDTQNINMVNQAYSNYYVDRDGRVRMKGTNEIIRNPIPLPNNNTKQKADKTNKTWQIT